MSELYFLARHTPFWAIPVLILAAEFGYMFWLRKKKKRALLCFTLAMLALFSASFYWWAGGPEKSVKFIKKLHRDHQ